MKNIPDTNQQKSNSKTMMCDSDYAGAWESVGLDTLKRKNSADTICKTIFCNFCSYSIEIGSTPVLQSYQKGKKTIKYFTDCSPKGLDEHQFYLGKHILQSQSSAFWTSLAI